LLDTDEIDDEREAWLELSDTIDSGEEAEDMVLTLGITCGALGTLVTAFVLVNEQRPDGDFISSVGDTVEMDHWMLSDGVVFGFLGWLPTVIAAAILPAVFTLGEARLGLGERKA